MRDFLRQFLWGRHFLRQWWRWARLDDRRWAARRVSWDEVLKVGGSHQQLPTPPFSTQIRLDQTHICHLWWNPHLLLTWDQDANQNRAQRFKQDEGILCKHLQSNPPGELNCYQIDLKVEGSHQQLPTPPFSTQIRLDLTSSVTSRTSSASSWLVQDAKIHVGAKIPTRQGYFMEASSEKPTRRA